MSAEKEIIELVGFLIRDRAIGNQAVRGGMGNADYYACPGCRRNTRIQGYHWGNESYDYGDHEEDCDFIKLGRMVEAYKESSIAERLRELAKEASSEVASLIETAANKGGQDQVDAIKVAADLATEKGE